MKDIAPASKLSGIAAIAIVFGVVAAGVAWVLFGYGFFGGLFIGLLIAALTAAALLFGWREPLPTRSENTTAAASAAEPVAAPEPSAPVATAPEPTPAPVAATPDPAPAAAPEPAIAEPAAPAETPEPAPASSEDGKPALLSAARAGGPDDLKQIKGVGPKLEKTLHEMGVFHFDQIAAWGPQEQAWMDQNLAGFKGRATRDNWVAQAKTLAAGG